jgi:hypothetical protein
MIGLHSLWLPILLSSAGVFVISSLIHMVLPWHKGDYPKLPDEDRFREALRPLNLPPGDYMVPRPASREEMGSPAFAEKMKQGPVMVLTVMRPGPVAIGKNLVQWFLYCVVVSVLAGYVTGRALPFGASYRRVFRFAGATSFIAYSIALWQMCIWYGRDWRVTLKSNVDGFIYALVTAGMFGWLWPR